MRHIGRRGISTRKGVRGALLVMIALFGLMLVPALALGIAEGGPITAPAAQAPVNTAAPTLTGTPALGQTLSCSTGTWANNPTSFSYAWLRSGVPIAGQTAGKYVVQAADQGHTISCQVTAGNGGGSYTIMGLPSGSYKVGFYSGQGGGTNYLDQYYNGKGTEAEGTPVAVTSPATTQGVNAELHAGGAINGRVTAAATHAPLADVDACAYEGEKYVGCAETNANGEYTITGLATGSYVVEFSSFGIESEYLSQYYSGESAAVEAQRVGVTAGTTVAGINGELQSANQGGQISGVVTAKVGKALLGGIDVCAESESTFFGNCAYTNSKGEYTITGLHEGSFKVSFYAEDCETSPCTTQNYVGQYYDGKSSYDEGTLVPVLANATTPAIDAEMEVGGRLEGRVLSAGTGEPAIADVDVCVFESSTYVGCAETEANGHYKIEGLPTGTYNVDFNAFAGDYLGQAVEKVSVKAGETVNESDVKLAVGGQITGRVTGAPGHGAVEGAEVCAEVGGENVGFCGSTNVNGEYTISALTSNTYTVNFFPPESETPYVSQAKPGVPVTEGNTIPNVDAELQVGGQISGVVTDATPAHAGIAKIDVCAVSSGYEKCAYTSTGAASASAASNALTVPGGGFTLKKVSFDSKSNDLDFFFTFPTAGKLTWGLFFKNADVGFADSLGLSLQANGVAAEAASTREIAEAAGKHKSKGCKKGTIKHHGKCVHVLVSFAAGSQSVAAGSVEVKVHASSKAIRALKEGHTLHVSGTFIFQSAFGGPAVAKQESAVVRLPKKHSKAKGHGKGKRR